MPVPWREKRNRVEIKKKRNATDGNNCDDRQTKSPNKKKIPLQASRLVMV
jgi:hypothetical protein